MEDIKKEAEKGSFYVYISYSDIFDNKTTLKNGDTTDNLVFREVIKQLKSLGYKVSPYPSEFRIYWRTIIE